MDEQSLLQDVVRLQGLRKNRSLAVTQVDYLCW
jgi:hypothetical protein